MQKILIMGLPGSGKTTFTKKMVELLKYHKKTVVWFNADDVRCEFDDWDFSHAGRVRQAVRMWDLAEQHKAGCDYVICDFVAPYDELRAIFSADWTIWMDTIEQSRFSDTNSVFKEPEKYDFRIFEQDAERWATDTVAKIIANKRKPVFDDRKETVQMLGRWQPWRAEHRALFECAVKKTGQVCIMIRDCQGWNSSNPFSAYQAKRFIERDLDTDFAGMYKIIIVPNIVNYNTVIGVTNPT